MIFSELYSAYYNTVAKIIARLLDGAPTDEKELRQIVSNNAFGESALTVLPALKSGRWQLMHPDLSTPIRNIPSMPLTKLELRWLRAISLDARIKLFDIELPIPDDTEPLFSPEDYLVYDKYSDGDPYEDEKYVEIFRTVLSAVRDGAPIKICILSQGGKYVYTKCLPKRLEYSERDDKFRLITDGCRFLSVINLASVVECKRYCGEHIIEPIGKAAEYVTVTLKIKNDRNAPERAMLHFAHFEKRAEQLDEGTYLLRIRYQREDEAELVIRILSFGPMIEVTEPNSFRELIVKKLIRQKNLGPK